MDISSRFLNIPGLASYIGFVDVDFTSSIRQYKNDLTGESCLVCYAHEGSFNDPKFGVVNAPFFLYNLGEDGGDREDDEWRYMTGEMVIKLIHSLDWEIVGQSEFLGPTSLLPDLELTLNYKE